MIFTFQQSQNMDFIMLTVLATSSIGMSTIFVYCYFGKLATISYEKMPDRLFEMNWHEQPNELQKFFILMIANSQKPVYYHGFEVAKLNLETFVNVIVHPIFSIQILKLQIITYFCLIFNSSYSGEFFHFT